MRLSTLSWLLVFSGLGLPSMCARAQPAPEPSLLPLTDNSQAPYMGDYEGCAALGIKGNGLYTAWLNRTNVWGVDFPPSGKGSTWDHISGQWQDWFYQPWSDWVAAGPNRRMVLAIPILPGPADHSGPTEGTGAGKPVSLAEGATGAYNDYFRGLAQTLVSHHLGNSILRIGWEWNVPGYTWEVKTADDARHFAAYWRQIVDTIRSVPGTENLKFDWNSSINNKTAYDPMEAYPGDTYVDYIGIDVYDQTWITTPEFPGGLYPLPAQAAGSEIEARQEAAWNQSYLPASQFGIAYWQKIADDHGKPLTFPEWGVLERSDHHSGLDNPYFVQKMVEYIQNPDHHVYFAAFFDCDGGSAGASRVLGVDGKPALFPKAAALFRQLCSLPGKSAAPAP